MSFRLKTILGIACIEAFVLAILLVSSLNYLWDFNLEALEERADLTAKIVNATIKESLITEDWATLESFSKNLLSQSRIESIKIYNAEDFLILQQEQVNNNYQDSIGMPFLLQNLSDDVLKVEKDIMVMGDRFGRIELIFSKLYLFSILKKAWLKFSALAFVELVLSALFSYSLGTYLTRYLNRFKQAANNIANGNIGYQMSLTGHDELAQTAKTFNLMSSELQRSYQHLDNKKSWLSSILSTVAEGVMTIDQNGLVSSCNQAAEDIFGFSAKEIIGKTSCELISEKFSSQWRQFLLDGVHQKKSCISFIEGQRKNGTCFPMEVSMGCMVIDNNVFYNCIIRDISEKYETGRLMEISRKVFEHTSEAILITDKNSCIIDVNPAYERLMGYSRAELIGLNPAKVKSMRHSKKFYQDIWHDLNQKGIWHGEIWDRKKDGEIFPSLLTINVIKDKNDRVTNYVAVFQDITQQKLNEQQLEKLAHYDQLTKLPNRVLFYDRLRQEIEHSKRLVCEFALLFVDLDRFKQVNDTLGHHFGDDLLVQVAERMQLCTRKSDTVARLGGDEFTIVLRQIKSRQEVERIAKHVIESLSSKFEVAGHQVFIGASIGIAVYPAHGKTLEAMIEYADYAMYQAKSAGRGQYRFFINELKQEDKLSD